MKRIKSINKTVAGTICSILATVFSFVLLYPQIISYAALTSDISAAEKLIEFSESRLERSDLYADEAEALEAELSAGQAMIPSFEKLAGNIVYINTLMSDCRISEKEFSIGEPVTADSQMKLYKVTIKLRGTGRFGDVMDFIRLINEAETLYVVEEAAMSSTNADTDNVEIYLRAALYGVKSEEPFNVPEGLEYDGKNPFYYD